jgi:hypothetical protein
MRMKYGVTLALVAALSGTAASAMAADLYVATTGSDSNPGTQAAPFLTITEADSVAVPGTTIHVAPGIYTYTGSYSFFQTNASGTASAHIVYISDTTYGAQIVPRSSDSIAWQHMGAYTDIIGFDVTGPSAHDGLVLGGGNSTAQYNHVHDVAQTTPCDSKGGSAINGNDADTPAGINYVFNANWVHDIGQPSGGCHTIQGLYMASPGYVTNNIVYNVEYAAIALWHDADHVAVVNNTVFKSGYGIIVGTGNWYYRTSPGDYNVVNNNIVRDNPVGIIEESGGVGYGLHNTYTNNISYNNADCNNIVSCVIAPAGVSGTINADPQFFDYGEDDCIPQATSPAINAATSAYAPSADFDGNPRPQVGSSGSGYDIGAYNVYVP